jgi:hypothetical protein
MRHRDRCQGCMLTWGGVSEQMGGLNVLRGAAWALMSQGVLISAARALAHIRSRSFECSGPRSNQFIEAEALSVSMTEKPRNDTRAPVCGP